MIANPIRQTYNVDFTRTTSIYADIVAPFQLFGGFDQ